MQFVSKTTYYYVSGRTLNLTHLPVALGILLMPPLKYTRLTKSGHAHLTQICRLHGHKFKLALVTAKIQISADFMYKLLIAVFCRYTHWYIINSKHEATGNSQDGHIRTVTETVSHSKQVIVVATMHQLM